MGTWSDAYEQQPKSFNNPGFGAREFNVLKGNTRERGALEHIWGADESTLVLNGGLHKEGSARALVLDDTSASRDPATKVETTEEGRIRVDFQELVDQRTQNGENDWAGRDAFFSDRNLILDVSGNDDNDINQPSWHTLFASDNYVDVVHDQEINGVKDFTLSPRVPNIDDALFATDYTPTADELRYAVSLEDVKDRLQDSRYGNMFNAYSQENIDQAAATADYNISTFVIDGTFYDVTDQRLDVSNIVAENITGINITGVVWV